MRGFISIAAAIVFASGASSPVRAHEHWVDVDAFYPAVGATVTVHVCSGHYFPKSSFVVQRKVLHEVSMHMPGQNAMALSTAEREHEKRRAAVFGVESVGVHMVTFCLKRPRAKAPSYEGKVLLVAGGKDGLAAYTVGRGLELVPGRAISGLKPGDELPVTVSLDGVSVSASVTVVPENGRSGFVRVATDRPGIVRIGAAGRYLLTASVKGRGCSLVFRVRRSEGGPQ